MTGLNLNVKLTLMKALAREEGFEIPSSRAQRNNNPGNLNFSKWMVPLGAVLETTPSGEIPRFAKFLTPESGYDAMRELLLNHYLGLTIHAALLKWAPPSDNNNTSSYEANVCKWTGLLPETVITGDIIT